MVHVLFFARAHCEPPQELCRKCCLSPAAQLALEDYIVDLESLGYIAPRNLDLERRAASPEVYEHGRDGHRRRGRDRGHGCGRYGDDA